MTRNLLTLAGACMLATTLAAQQPTPATQPVRPPDRPPSGEPTPTLPLPAPDRGDDDERPLSGRVTPEEGDLEGATVTLKGCVERVDSRTYRLRGTSDNDATVTDDVRLAGAIDQLRAHVGKLVEVRGTYEQATPAATDAFFSVTRVKAIAGQCDVK